MRHLLPLLFAVFHAAGAPSVRVLTTLTDLRITESSGLAVSRARPGIYWTHNDSGDGPFLYAFDRAGRPHGRWRVRGARAEDWEDIALGPGPNREKSYLYVGDIGDNAARRRGVVVYRVEEPAAECPDTCTTAAATAIRLRFPDGPHNAEALLVHPATGDLYIVTKATGGSETAVYKTRPRSGTLRRIATLDIPGPLYRMLAGGITGGDIAPDGRRLALSDYFRAYEAVLPAGAPFDAIWKQPFEMTALGMAFQVEGIAYSRDGQSLVATSEGHPCPLIEVQGR